MKKVLAVFLAAAAMVGLTFGQLEAADKYTLRIGTSQTDQAFITRAYMTLADRLMEKSGGRLEVKVFPAGQLGGDEDILEQAIQGAPVAVNTDAGRTSAYVKETGILMMAYFADNYDECLKVTQTETFKKWEQDLATKHGIRVLAFNFYDGPRHFMTNKPINTPADLKGQRIRTIGSEVCVESIAAMGATPVSMSWGEVYNGIQSKALDGCEAQNTSTYPSKIYEVAKYQSKTGHFQLMQALLCGEVWFQSLPQDLQQLLLDTAREVGAETAAQLVAASEESEKAMVEAGLTVIEPDTTPFKEAVKPAYDKLGLRAPCSVSYRFWSSFPRWPEPADILSTGRRTWRSSPSRGLPSSARTFSPVRVNSSTSTCLSTSCRRARRRLSASSSTL